MDLSPSVATSQRARRATRICHILPDHRRMPHRAAYASTTPPEGKPGKHPRQREDILHQDPLIWSV